MDDAAGLNPPQLAATHHVRGPLVVFAGAGSGKTRVITYRIAHLVDQCTVPAYRILAVTFTNKAAQELRERLTQLIPGAAQDLWVGTFHALCAKLLRRYGPEIDVRPDFVIYDDSDQKAMITRLMRDMNLDDKRFAPKAVAGRINRAKQEGLSPDDLSADDPLGEVALTVYRAYDEKMAACGALDFGDLIYRVVLGMRNHPEFLATLQKKFEYVLVDEFQDTNHIQFELVAQLCQEHRNLCVVGDDDQSIYRWRGADRRNILNFRARFEDAEVVKLEQNYRSTQRILEVAYAVVRNNVDREPKRLWTDNEEGAPVTVVACEDERDEAQMVLQAITMLLQNDYARRDIAILYRTHAQSRVIEEGLRHYNLPYRVYGGLRFYDRAEVKDLMAYLRILQNPDDDISLLRIINTPTRGIGKTTVTRLLDSAAQSGTSVFQALGQAVTAGQWGAATTRRLGGFYELLLDLQKQVTHKGPADLAQEVLSQTGYVEILQNEDSAEADSRLENLKEVISSMIEFEREAEQPTLAAFLELVTLQTDADRAENESDDLITLMTVHAAKGLEFPIVFVAGLEEETFPHRGFGIDDDPDELEEERRLAYVALTRAEERLFLTYAQARRVYGELKFRRRSRFIDEMPADCLNLVGGRKPPAQQRPATAAYSSRPSQQTRSSTEPYVDTSDGTDDSTLPQRGMQVRHKKFGVGTVVDVTPGMPPRVSVQFPGWGCKQILSRFLEPT